MPRASEPVALAPVGTYRDMHLAIVPGDHRGEDRLPRHALRLTVGVRNQTLTEALIRLAASVNLRAAGRISGVLLRIAHRRGAAASQPSPR